MSRYQVELEEMDRKRRLRIRVVSGIGAAGLIAVAMWSAGVPNSSWFMWARDRAEVQPLAETRRSEKPARLSQQGHSDQGQRLRLISTTLGQNATEGVARIAAGDGEALTYAAGALLGNGSLLSEVYADHVILTRGSQRIALYVDGMAEYANTEHSSETSDSLLIVDESPAPPRRGKPAPATYTELMRAAPRFENDQLIGFDVYPGTTAGKFSRMGLQSADLLLAIDGAPLTSTEALNAALKSITEGRSGVARIRRGSEQLDVLLDGAALVVSETMAGIPSSP